MNKSDADRKTLRIALVANLVMFVIGLVGWVVAHSTGLLADAFDMLADAAGYGWALLAVVRAKTFQENVARWNGSRLVCLGRVWGGGGVWLSRAGSCVREAAFVQRACRWVGGAAWRSRGRTRLLWPALGATTGDCGGKRASSAWGKVSPPTAVAAG
mgnify:CR=1 FL=1